MILPNRRVFVSMKAKQNNIPLLGGSKNEKRI